MVAVDLKDEISGVYRIKTTVKLLRPIFISCNTIYDIHKSTRQSICLYMQYDHAYKAHLSYFQGLPQNTSDNDTYNNQTNHRH